MTCAQAQALMLLRDWDPAPDACFMARVQAILAAGELKRDGNGKVNHPADFGMLPPSSLSSAQPSVIHRTFTCSLHACVHACSKVQHILFTFDSA